MKLKPGKHGAAAAAEEAAEEEEEEEGIFSSTGPEQQALCVLRAAAKRLERASASFLGRLSSLSVSSWASLT